MINRKKAKHSGNDLGSSPVGKLLFELALPAVTAQIVNVLYNIVDRMYIGHIPDVGPLALTGLGVCMPLIMLVSASAALISMGGAPRSTIVTGAGNKAEAEHILGNCTTLLLLMSCCLTIFFLLFGKPLLFFFGASENTIGYAWQYMSIYTLGTIFVQLSLGLNAFITSQGFAKTSMLTVLIGAVSNIILDPILIFGFDMGVRGAAIATIISQGISAVWVLRFLCGSKTHLKIRLRYLKLNAGIILPCLALGLSPFIMQSTESLITICFNSSLLKYGGDLAVGAMTILSSVMQFSMLPLMGLTQGAQPIISYNYGARNAARVRQTFRLLLTSGLLYSSLLWILIMAAPQLFAMMFTKNQELLTFTAHSIRIYMAVSFLFGIQLSCQQTFIAIGNAKASLFLAVLRKIILLIPLIYILPMFLTDQVTAVFLAEPVADFLAVLTTSLLFFSQFKKAMANLEKPYQPAADR